VYTVVKSFCKRITVRVVGPWAWDKLTKNGWATSAGLLVEFTLPDLAIISLCCVLWAIGVLARRMSGSNPISQPHGREPSFPNEDIDSLIWAQCTKITQRITRITNTKLAKRRLTIILAIEYAAMRYVSQHTSIPLPRAHLFQRRTILSRDGLPWRGSPRKSLANEASIIGEFRNSLPSELAQIRGKMREDNCIFFTHGNLSQENILVQRINDTEFAIVAILDWE